MPLTTRCVACGRQFPVYAQQLKGRRARVDCPHCGEHMDAVAGLIDESGFGGGPAGPRGRAGANAGANAGAGPAAPRPGAVPRPSMVSALVPAGAPTVARLRTTPVAATPSGRSARARLGWRLAALVLTVSLGAQLAWWRRADLLRDPRSFQALSALCGRLGCTLTPARLPGALAVREPSLTPDQSGVLTLRLRLENSAALPQPAPLIELELYDQQGDLAAVRRFSPDEYAAPASAEAPTSAGSGAGSGRAPRLPLAPGESRTVALALAPAHAETSGFKVRLR